MHAGSRFFVLLTLALSLVSARARAAEIAWRVPESRASLSLARLGGLNAGLYIEVDDGSPLLAIVPRFSAPPVAAPVLNVALNDVARDAISSDWRWSAFVPCAAGAQCTGGPVPGANGPTTGDEGVWGGATLTRQ
jgi:hypothetical protein